MHVYLQNSLDLPVFSELDLLEAKHASRPPHTHTLREGGLVQVYVVTLRWQVQLKFQDLQQQELNLTVDRVDILEYFIDCIYDIKSCYSRSCLVRFLDEPGFSSLCWSQQGVCVSPVLLPLLCQVSEHMLPVYSRAQTWQLVLLPEPLPLSNTLLKNTCPFTLFTVSDLVCIHRFIVYMQTHGQQILNIRHAQI